ncbi:MAG TPA: RNA-binding cell elongation regulator Jag/EloR [Rectinemataceae bacterium]|nr:RNA-binding cell elongation regulator Jag/EloR [Rectinemataceae bacterium]
MVHEFEGRTEKEAIDAAIRELGLERDGFDVEILESEAGGIFRKGHVKIRVHSSETPAPVSSGARNERAEPAREEAPAIPISGEFEDAVVGFTKKVIEGMGYDAEVSVVFREDRKLGLRIDSEHASIIIGKKGKNLDALQLLVNVYAGRAGRDDVRVILDSENYRIRREESLVRLAYDTAEEVRKTRQSILLEPMNPFERRIVHTTLNDIVDVTTKSEGEGLYKQVRVHFRGRP